jgi:surfactin synthase thioesterase subunit
LKTVDSTPSLWIRRYHRSAAGAVRLVCFPHAGGSASFFHPVSARFSPDVDVVAVQYPGRQDRRREPCIDDIGTLADRIIEALSALDDRPTAFFGHSMGAILAFETAWRLEQGGAGGPTVLIASGRRAPSTHRVEAVHRLDDDGVIAEIRMLNSEDSILLGDDEIRQMAIPAIRGDLRAIETYVCEPGRRISCPVTALVGDNDPKSTVEEARAWRHDTDGAFRIRVFPGGHFYLMDHQSAVNDEIALAVGG